MPIVCRLSEQLRRRMQKESGSIFARDSFCAETRIQEGMMSQAVIRQEAVQAEPCYRVSARKRRVLAGKKLVSAVILRFLFQGLSVLAEKEERIQEEVESWEPGFTWGISMGEQAPALYMEWTGERLNRLPVQTDPQKLDLLIRFKSVDAAFPVMAGQVGIAGAYARHYFSLKGDIARAMSVVRCVDLAEAYLFPKIMTKRILKEVPETRMGLIRTYGAVIGAMIGGMVR